MIVPSGSGGVVLLLGGVAPPPHPARNTRLTLPTFAILLTRVSLRFMGSPVSMHTQSVHALDPSIGPSQGLSCPGRNDHRSGDGCVSAQVTSLGGRSAASIDAPPWFRAPSLLLCSHLKTIQSSSIFFMTPVTVLPGERLVMKSSRPRSTTTRCAKAVPSGLRTLPAQSGSTS
jgi:hypothetical protein